MIQEEEHKNAERLRIGRRIAEIRAERGLSIRDLEALTGVQNSHISRIEAGRYSVGFDILQLIAEALGYNIDFVKPSKKK